MVIERNFNEKLSDSIHSYITPLICTRHSSVLKLECYKNGEIKEQKDCNFKTTAESDIYILYRNPRRVSLSFKLNVNMEYYLALSSMLQNVAFRTFSRNCTKHTI